MKSLLICVASMLSMSALATKEDLQGKWYAVEGKNDTIVYEFDKDTLYIDELAVEGFRYTYTLSEDVVVFTDVFGTTDTFNIIALDKNELVIKYNDVDECFTFTKVK